MGAVERKRSSSTVTAVMREGFGKEKTYSIVGAEFSGSLKRREFPGVLFPDGDGGIRAVRLEGGGE